MTIELTKEEAEAVMKALHGYPLNLEEIYATGNVASKILVEKHKEERR